MAVMFGATPFATVCALFAVMRTNNIISAGDRQRFSVDQGVGDFAARIIIDALHGGAGDQHLRGAFFLCVALEIDQPNRFILIHGQHDRFGCNGIWGRKYFMFWHAANITFFWRPWHVAPHF